MKIQEQTICLSGEGIDTAAEQITEFLTRAGTDKKETLRIRLRAEDILLRWQERFGTEAEVTLQLTTQFRQKSIRLILPGEAFDPLTGEDAWSRKLLADLQTTPTYRYGENQNTVVFRLIREKRNPLIHLLIALLAAGAVGALGMVIPGSFCSDVAEKILTPICNRYMEALNFFGIPLIFLSVLLGICGVGNVASFDRIGRKMLLHFAVVLTATAALSTLVLYPMFPFTHGTAGTVTGMGGVRDMLLGFIPTNLLTPFIECNAMQLIIMGAVLGVTALRLDIAGGRLMNALDDLNRLLLWISNWFTRLIPFFVFSILVKCIWDGSASGFLSVWKPWVIALVLQVAVLAVMAGLICLKHKASFLTVCRKVRNTFLIATGTGSCCATIPEIYDTCGKLGVHPDVFVFGVPVSTVVFKPCALVRILVLTFFMASQYGVGVSLQWFLLAAVMTVLISVAAPAIPGGVLLFYPMLFAQLGLPAEALAAVLTVDVLFDALSTGFCQVAAELALARQAGKLGLLDEETLRK